jgi:hypothetical protein
MIIHGNFQFHPPCSIGEEDLWNFSQSEVIIALSITPCLKSDPQNNSNLVEDLLYIIPTNLQPIWLNSFSDKIFCYLYQSKTSIAHCGHVWNPIDKKMSYNKTTENAICSSFRENVLSYSLYSFCWFSKSYLPCERVFRYLWHNCTWKFLNLFSGTLLLQTPFFLCIFIKVYLTA